MNPALIELIILAGIAVFLFLRLRSVLGTREGFEKPRMQPKNDACLLYTSDAADE